VLLCGFFRMASSLQVVAMCDMGMMPRLFMAPAGLVLSRFFMMAGRMFMVLRRFCMMFCALLAQNKTIIQSSWNLQGGRIRRLGTEFSVECTTGNPAFAVPR
jgi:hypothetical protein